MYGDRATISNKKKEEKKEASPRSECVCGVGVYLLLLLLLRIRVRTYICACLARKLKQAASYFPACLLQEQQEKKRRRRSRKNIVLGKKGRKKTAAWPIPFFFYVSFWLRPHISWPAEQGFDQQYIRVLHTTTTLRPLPLHSAADRLQQQQLPHNSSFPSTKEERRRRT